MRLMVPFPIAPAPNILQDKHLCRPQLKGQLLIFNSIDPKYLVPIPPPKKEKNTVLSVT